MKPEPPVIKIVFSMLAEFPKWSEVGSQHPLSSCPPVTTGY